MLEFAGKFYAKSEKEFIGTLFAPIEGRTAHGLYKKQRAGYLLCTPQGHPKAFVVANPKQGYFVVSAANTAYGIRYMYSASDEDAVWLGINGMTYSQEGEACKAVKEF